MVEIYESEQEQIDAIKNWWHDNGRSVVVGIVLGVVILLGYSGWQRYTTQRDEGASSVYFLVSEALDNKDYAKVESLAADLVSKFPSTHYASLAQFAAANAAVNQQNLDAALKNLAWVADKAKSVDLKAIAHLRLAQLQISLEKLDAAKATLGYNFAPAYNARVSELRGDLAVAQKDIAGARDFYRQALSTAGMSQNQSTSMLLQLKLENLGTEPAPQATASEAADEPDSTQEPDAGIATESTESTDKAAP